MRNWDKIQAKKQIEHYSTSKEFPYEVSLNQPLPPRRMIRKKWILRGLVGNSFYSQTPAFKHKNWLDENVGYKNWMYDNGTFKFSKEIDALAFKLAWQE